jgi:hypothetical protein
MRSNSSHWPIAVLLAISGSAPAPSAVTMSLLACALRLISNADGTATSATGSRGPVSLFGPALPGEDARQPPGGPVFSSISEGL